MQEPAGLAAIAGPEDVALGRARPVVAQHEVREVRLQEGGVPEVPRRQASDHGGCRERVVARAARPASRRTAARRRRPIAGRGPGRPCDTRACCRGGTPICSPQCGLNSCSRRSRRSAAISARKAASDWACDRRRTRRRRTAGSSWVRSVRRVTTPKLPPPPPLSAQKRSGLVQALAMRTAPSAVTTSASSRPAAASAEALGEAAEAAALHQAGDAHRRAAAALHVAAGLAWSRRRRPAARSRRRPATRPAAGASLQPGRRTRRAASIVVHVARPDQQRVGRVGRALIAVAAAFHHQPQAMRAGEVDRGGDVGGVARGDRVGARLRRPGVDPAEGLGQPDAVADIPGVLQAAEEPPCSQRPTGSARQASIGERHSHQLAARLGVECIPLRSRRPGRIARDGCGGRTLRRPGHGQSTSAAGLPASIMSWRRFMGKSPRGCLHSSGRSAHDAANCDHRHGSWDDRLALNGTTGQRSIDRRAGHR